MGEKCTLLRILTARMCRIYRLGVDEDVCSGQNLSKQACRRSEPTLFCQTFSAQFYRKPRDRDIHRYRRTASMIVTVFWVFPTGADSGG